MLRDVQRATEQERERYRGHDSVQKVYEMYQDDLNSDEAHEVHRKLDKLGLPTVPREISSRTETEHPRGPSV